MKIRTLIISIALMALFVTVFGSFYSTIGNEYEVTYDENTSSTMSAFNEFEAIGNLTQDLDQQLFNSTESESGSLDLLGKFLGSGFNVLKITKGSFTAFRTIASNALGIVGLPKIFFDVLITIAAIIVAFLIISVLVGKDV